MLRSIFLWLELLLDLIFSHFAQQSCLNLGYLALFNFIAKHLVFYELRRYVARGEYCGCLSGWILVKDWINIEESLSTLELIPTFEFLGIYLQAAYCS